MPQPDFPERYHESFIWRTCHECGHTDCIKGILPLGDGQYSYGSILDFCSNCEAMREEPECEEAI